MTERPGKLYRVLQSGCVSQLEGDVFVERAKDEEIRLSPDAAIHLLSAGYVEEVKATKGKTEASA